MLFDNILEIGVLLAYDLVEYGVVLLKIIDFCPLIYSSNSLLKSIVFLVPKKYASPYLSGISYLNFSTYSFFVTSNLSMSLLS